MTAPDHDAARWGRIPPGHEATNQTAPAPAWQFSSCPPDEECPDCAELQRWRQEKAATTGDDQ